jgi:hypothetical protein
LVLVLVLSLSLVAVLVLVDERGNAMDMNRHLRRWLNGTALRREFGGHYEGIIAEVLEEKLKNTFTATKELQPVIVFEDGWRLCPNIGMRRALINIFGPETKDWVGRRIVVFQRRVERTSDSGGVIEAFEKAVMLAGADVVPIGRRRAGS